MSRVFCEHGCVCDRHTIKPYDVNYNRRVIDELKTKGKPYTCEEDRCKLPNDEDTGRCECRIRNQKTRVCSKHYARMCRHGTYDKLPNQGAQKVKHELTMLHEQGKVPKKDKPFGPCMCGCPKRKHAMGTNKCHAGKCDCRQYEEASAELHIKNASKIIKLVFYDHFNKKATCINCEHEIEIGRWWDNKTIKRAIEHKTRLCSKLRKKSVIG